MNDFKTLLQTTEYDFIRENERLGDRIMLLGLGGSYAYGTIHNDTVRRMVAGKPTAVILRKPIDKSNTRSIMVSQTKRYATENQGRKNTLDHQIIAVDFDGTLCYSNWPDTGEPNMRLINYLNRMRRQGHKVILWTCRAGEALDLAVAWCKSYALEFDAVNDNLPEIVEKYGNNSRKITCDYYIDDRALLPDGVL